MPRHLPTLDGLRGIAVLLVLWCHVPLVVPGYPEWLHLAYWLIGPGGLGVEIFFVLSGFLITRILLHEREQGAPVRWFLLRRLLRIFPIYYLLLVLLVPFRPAEELGWCAVYLHNLRTIVAPAISPLDHTWSLCIEEHFYLLWPLAVAFGTRRTAKNLLLFVLMPCAVVGAVAVTLLVDDGHTARTIVQHGSPFRCLGLGAGSLLAFAEPWLWAHRGRALGLATGLGVLALALHPHVVFLAVPLSMGREWIPLRFEPAIWLVHMAATGSAILLFALFAAHARWSPLRCLHWQALRGVGRISYGLYLWHLPIYYYTVGPSPTLANAVFAVAATFAAALVSWVLIERPVLRYAGRFRQASDPERLRHDTGPLPTVAAPF